MSALLQVATQPQAFSMQHAYEAVLGIALLVIGWNQTRSQKDRDELRAENIAQAQRILALEVHNAELRAHIGLDGNGLLARFDRFEEKMEDRFDSVAKQVADLISHVMKRGTT